MTRLYGRRFSLKVADAQGDALDLSELHCKFIVRQWERETPNTLDIRVFNLSKRTVDRLAAREFNRVVLEAGYRDLLGVIFDGLIVQTRRGRTSPVDTFLDITAGDGDQAHNFAVVNTTLAAGAKPADVHRALCTAMDPHGVGTGYTADLPGPALPRGRVLYGTVRDHMRALANSTGTVWNINNGQVEFIARTGYRPNEAVVLTPETGLVGLPTQTQDGLGVRALLNPLLKVANRVQLQNAAIQQARAPVLYGPDKGAIADPRAEYNLKQSIDGGLDGVGTYRVLAIDHVGDTRGTEWYSDIACIGVDGTVPIGEAQKFRGGDGPAT